MISLCYYLYDIPTPVSSLPQSICIDVKPVKGFSDCVLILHLEAMLPVVAHIFGNVYHTSFILEHIDISEESHST